MRQFTRFQLKDSNLRICSNRVQDIVAQIRALRRDLETYIARHPEFLTSLVPVGVFPDAPGIARTMALAAARVGVGPMAAVAGAFAEAAARHALANGADEAIVENGGDMFLCSTQQVTVGVYAGPESPLRDLAFRITPDTMPLAICSSSAHMGHSLSTGACDLATVVAAEAALADAAATFACNSVRKTEDIPRALDAVLAIGDIRGVLLVKDEQVGMAGRLPELVRAGQPDIEATVTRDPRAAGSLAPP